MGKDVSIVIRSMVLEAVRSVIIAIGDEPVQSVQDGVKGKRLRNNKKLLLFAMSNVHTLADRRHQV